MLFAVWLTNLILLALYSFESMAGFSFAYAASVIVAQAVTLIEVAAYLLFSIRSVLKPKEKPSNFSSRISLQADEVMGSHFTQL